MVLHQIGFAKIAELQYEIIKQFISSCVSLFDVMNKIKCVNKSIDKIIDNNMKKKHEFMVQAKKIEEILRNRVNSSKKESEQSVKNIDFKLLYPSIPGFNS